MLRQICHTPLRDRVKMKISIKSSIHQSYHKDLDENLNDREDYDPNVGDGKKQNWVMFHELQVINENFLKRTNCRSKITDSNY